MSAYPSVWRLIKPLLVLPGTVLVLVPGLILWATGGPAGPLRWPSVVVGVGAGALGLGLAGWTMRLFATRGRGTPAPWDPPARLVVVGPYRHVRNPMITGVLLMLLAEALSQTGHLEEALGVLQRVLDGTDVDSTLHERCQRQRDRLLDLLAEG